ncbi:DUF4344 domain-containing metallopeptidase [Marinomonas sp. MED121]|uniref:DUF4344 domain-containing metallopeptidase n=1 Tax=Marinomonas sp. MED121 TaxID=314277 RepID=UPI0002E74B65|nr:DUF4344 domain-containing metallopeptidase [Marinomonas sp. MED121]
MRFIVIVFAGFFSIAAQANLKLEWLAPELENQDVKQLLESSKVLQTSVELINDNWQLEDDILLRLGGEEDPYYDPETSTIYFSYYFADEIAQRFIAANPNADLAAQNSFVISGVVHTLFHEYAHVLVDYLNLPVLGREEDAADSFASYVLLTMMQDGPQLLKDGADLFYLESLDPEPFASVMLSDSHSLPIQRFYMSLCHLFASDEQAYQYLITEHDFDEEWVNTCFMDYDIIISSWQALLFEEGAES